MLAHYTKLKIKGTGLLKALAKLKDENQTDKKVIEIVT